MMQWGSLGNFLNMGGYAFFVWGAYGVCALAIAAEIMLARARHRRALAAIVQQTAQRRTA